VESSISTVTDDLITEATTLVANKGSDFQVLDATESTLHKIMRQRHLALTKTMKEVPEDEMCQIAHSAREAFLLKSMAGELDLHKWRDVQTARIAVEQRLQVLKQVPEPTAQRVDAETATNCLRSLNACLMISEPAYRKKRYNLQVINKPEHMKEEDTSVTSSRDSARDTVQNRKRTVALGFISGTEEVTYKVSRRDIGLRFRSHWAGKNPEVSYVRPQSQAEKAGIAIGHMLVKVDHVSLTALDYPEKLGCLRDALLQLEAKPPAHTAYSVAISFLTKDKTLATRHFTKQPFGFTLGRKGRCGLCSVGAKVTAVGFDGEAIENDIDVGWFVQSIGDQVVERWGTERVYALTRDTETQLPEVKRDLVAVRQQSRSKQQSDV